MMAKKAVDLDWNEEAFRKSLISATNRKHRMLSGLADQVANQLENTSKQLVPVVTGKLRAGLRASWERRGDDYLIALKSSEDYWHFPEFGTMHQSPQPFARPAFKSGKQIIRNKLS